MENNSIQFTEVKDEFDELEVLAAIAPPALKEGAMLVEFKSSENETVRTAMVLTLHEDDCPIKDQPEADNPADGVWAWNVRAQAWIYLRYKDVDVFQNWPPMVSDVELKE